MKKSFSLLEMIFVLSIVIIFTSFVFFEIYSKLSSTNNIARIKVELALIKNAIKKNYQKSITKGLAPLYIKVLDKSKIDIKNEFLFTGYVNNLLLRNIIKSSSQKEKKEASWIKISKNKYLIYLGNEEVIFEYTPSNGRFDCNIEEKLCIKISL